MMGFPAMGVLNDDAAAGGDEDDDDCALPLLDDDGTGGGESPLGGGRRGGGRGALRPFLRRGDLLVISTPFAFGQFRDERLEIQ